MTALWFGTFTEWDWVIQSWDGEFGTMDKVWEVDKGKKSMRVEAGISVQQLVDGIKDFGLTLQNFFFFYGNGGFIIDKEFIHHQQWAVGYIFC